MTRASKTYRVYSIGSFFYPELNTCFDSGEMLSPIVWSHVDFSWAQNNLLDRHVSESSRMFNYLYCREFFHFPRSFPCFSPLLLSVPLFPDPFPLPASFPTIIFCLCFLRDWDIFHRGVIIVLFSCGAPSPDKRPPQRFQTLAIFPTFPWNMCPFRLFPVFIDR